MEQKTVAVLTVASKACNDMKSAFEDSSELILKGDHSSILDQLYVGAEGNTFYLRNGGKNYRLKPLYEIEDQSYGVRYNSKLLIVELTKKKN